MKKKYTLDYFQFFFMWFGPVFLAFLILTIYLTNIVLQAIFLFIYSYQMSQDPLLEAALISLLPLWLLVHVVWREFRFPSIWASNTGITALAIIIIVPIKLNIRWEEIATISDKKTLEGTLFEYGTSIVIKPTGKFQQWIFKLLGGNEIFISNKMSKHGELVSFIKENTK